MVGAGEPHQTKRRRHPGESRNQIDELLRTRSQSEHAARSREKDQNGRFHSRYAQLAQHLKARHVWQVEIKQDDETLGLEI